MTSEMLTHNTRHTQKDSAVPGVRNWVPQCAFTSINVLPMVEIIGLQVVEICFFLFSYELTSQLSV
jgi:hypothetical protein